MFCHLKKGFYPEVTHVLHCHIKLAFLLTVYVFKSALHRVCSADWRLERETGTRQRIGTNFRWCWMNQLHFLKLTSDTRSGRILPLPTRHSSRAKLLIDHSPPPIRLGRLKPTRSPLIYTWHKAQSHKYTIQTVHWAINIPYRLYVAHWLELTVVAKQGKTRRMRQEFSQTGFRGYWANNGRCFLHRQRSALHSMTPVHAYLLVTTKNTKILRRGQFHHWSA